MNFYDILSGQCNSHFERLFAQKMRGGKIQELSGVPPIAFTSNGAPLISWSMFGNSQQSGNPTPGAPIMPEFVGERTWNLAPPITEWVDGYVDTNGNIHSPSVIARERTSPFINIKDVPRNYYLYMQYEGGDFPNGGSGSAWTGIGYYNDEKAFISRRTSTGEAPVKQYTMPENAAYCRLSFRTYDETGNIMLNSGLAAIPYEPHGYKISITCAGQTTPVYLGQTPTVRRVKKHVLTGEESVSVMSTGIAVIVLDIPPVVGEECVCSHYIGTNDTSYSVIGAGECTTSIVASGGGNRLAINDADLSTVDAYKAFFAQQYTAGMPVTVWYVLAEPETSIINEPLAKIGDYADELHSTDAGVSIPTTHGNNMLTVDTTLQPSNVYLKYKGA